MPKVDPYPEPVSMSALDIRRIQRVQVEKGRDARLQRLARRNRDVAWLLTEYQRLTPVRTKKPKAPDAP